MFPLIYANLNKKYYIYNIALSNDEKKRLQTLGFIEGEPILVVNKIGNNFIVLIKDSKLALGEALTQKIYISEKKLDVILAKRNKKIEGSL